MADHYERWWLVTWTTYGTWLPGDPRGFQTWRGREQVPPPPRYAKTGEPVYDPLQYRGHYETASAAMVEEPVHLNVKEQRTAVQAIVAECEVIPFTPSILAVANAHVHLLVRIGSYSLRIATGRLKAAATRRLHEDGFPQQKVWCQGCHPKSKDTPAEIRSAFEYVRRHETEGAIVYIWRRPLE
jgi:hypothetical protein